MREARSFKALPAKHANCARWPDEAFIPKPVVKPAKPRNTAPIFPADGLGAALIYFGVCGLCYLAAVSWGRAAWFPVWLLCWLVVGVVSFAMEVWFGRALIGRRQG